MEHYLPIPFTKNLEIQADCSCCTRASPTNTRVCKINPCADARAVWIIDRHPRNRLPDTLFDMLIGAMTVESLEQFIPTRLIELVLIDRITCRLYEHKAKLLSIASFKRPDMFHYIF